MSDRKTGLVSQLCLVIPSEVENGASDMDGCAAQVAARESGDERVKSLEVFPE